MITKQFYRDFTGLPHYGWRKLVGGVGPVELRLTESGRGVGPVVLRLTEIDRVVPEVLQVLLCAFAGKLNILEL